MTSADAARAGSPDEARPPNVRSRVLTVVFLTVFLDMIGFGVVIPLLPLYVQSMGGSPKVVGVLFSCFSLSQLVATPILGRLSDRYGRRKIIVLSLAGNALSMVIFALATKLALLPMLFFSRILAGATAGNLSACQAAIADVTDREQRAAGMGRLGAGIGLGLVFGPVLGGVASHLGVWAPPLAAAGLAVVDLVLALVLMPETRRAAGDGPTAAPRRAPLAGLKDALGDPRLGPVLAVFFLVFLALTNIQVSLALMTKERLGWGEAEVGYTFALLGLCTLVVQAGLIGALVRRFGEVLLVLAGTALVGAGMIVLGGAGSTRDVIVGITVFGIGMGVSNPSLSSLASKFAPEDRQGETLGIAQSAGGLARTLGPTWSGFLFASLGARAPFLGGAVAAGAALLVTVYLRLHGARPRT